MYYYVRTFYFISIKGIKITTTHFATTYTNCCVRLSCMTHRICCDDDEIRKVTNSFDEGSRLLELSLDH